MGRKKILVIDDNTVNLATIEQELKEKYDVVPMISGRRAIKYLYCEKVDLILLDVQMPIMDGVETLYEIRKMENGTTVPVIFLTALKDKETVIAGSKLGILDYITKPFDGADLVNRIDAVFKKLGVLPTDDNDLLESMRTVLQYITLGKVKPAVIKVDEILRYQIDEEIAGRVRSVRGKLEDSDLTSAGNMVLRIIRMLEKKMGVDIKTAGVEINNRELSVKLLYILDELENYNTKGALERCHELKRYTLSEKITVNINLITELLVKYEDEEAEKLIKMMVDDLNKI
ncbi:MAG: response regulator [Lachnospiraceae bacterium]|nr:response regulator [Lachnospiraceae bacterium]